MNRPSCLVTCTLLLASADLLAAPPFTCGQYGPSKSINPSSELALTATALIASPGQPNLPDTFLQAGWFLIDSFGTGSLMGCQPVTSVIQGYSQQNVYGTQGLLGAITAQRFGSNPVTLRFEYDQSRPYRLQTAENFCMSIGAQKVRYSFSYSGERLSAMQQTPDSGCPSTTPSTVNFVYADAQVPGLPTLMTVTQSGQTVRTVRYAYALSGGVIQQVEVAPSDGNALSITLTHQGGLVTAMRWPGVNNAIGYHNVNQWASMIDPQHNWGLTISYVGDRVSATVQNTGCPGCPSSTFAY